MVGYKFSLTSLILVFCFIKVRCETAGRNQCGIKIPCDDSQCIDRQEWCDLVTDCTDESDEKYCQTKSFWSTPDNNCDAVRHFICENKKCIPKVLMCDGYDDCKDDSDEEDCGSSETGNLHSLNTSTKSTHSSQTDVPPHSSSTESVHNIKHVEPTVNYYDNRWTEEENTGRHHYNSATATASAYPFYPPDPTPDSRFPPASAGNWDERSFGNLDRQPRPDHFIRGVTDSPSQEPCDKTITRSDDDSTNHYRVPWSHFTFESTHSDTIKNQYYYNARRAQTWLLAQRDSNFIWGENTPRALVALSLSSDATNNLAANDILQRRLKIDLGARLIKWREEPLSTSRLALYINALIATCQNPRNIYEKNLVEMLYQMVQKEATRMDASPFPYLTLCLADKSLTEDAWRFLLDIARRPVTDEISKDKFILATSALACLKKTPPYNRELDRFVNEAFDKLLEQQLKDGSFGSIYSTALAAQALIAIDSRLWKPESTLTYLSSKQNNDGSFGDFLATYYALPVLNGKSLLHLRNIQCQIEPSPPPPPPTPSVPPVTSPPPFHTKSVRYRLATENPLRTLAHLDLVVPIENNFFDIMKKAQDEDKKFHFLYVEHDSKIDVYQINGIPNDPEFGLFWILYEVDAENNLRRYKEDIRDLIPDGSNELLFYYVHFKPEDQLRQGRKS